jgi:hypothetical protein
MKMTEGTRAVVIAVFMMVAFNGILLSVNGLFVLVAPLWKLRSASARPRSFPAISPRSLSGLDRRGAHGVGLAHESTFGIAR